MSVQKIDFVIPWVDGSDPEWIRERNRYAGKSEEDTNEARFRDWGILKFWFRGVEKFTPWVNHIYFVTWGHVPPWLNMDHPKLTVVRHEDYIPEKYLPVFNSQPIENNFHRIKGLNENFVLFNDDMFIIKPLVSTDFFVKDLPVGMAIYSDYMKQEARDAFTGIVQTDIKYINKKFNKNKAVYSNLFKWLYPGYGKYLILNLKALNLRTKFSGLITAHNPSPTKKSVMKEVWDNFHDKMDWTCSNKFRSPQGINEFIFRYWSIMKGQFKPRNVLKYSHCYNLKEINNIDLYEAIKTQKYKIICVNDNDRIQNFEKEQMAICESFNYILPEKSSYEL